MRNLFDERVNEMSYILSKIFITNHFYPMVLTDKDLEHLDFEELAKKFIENGIILDTWNKENRNAKY